MDNLVVEGVKTKALIESGAVGIHNVINLLQLFLCPCFTTGHDICIQQRLEDVYI